MSGEPKIDDLWRDLRPTLEAAYRRGFRDGEAAKSQEIMGVLQGTLDSAEPPGELPAPREFSAKAAEERRERAPRGAVRDAIKAWLPGPDSFVLRDAVAEIVASNPEISPKSVYNQFAALRKQGVYRSDGERLVRIRSGAVQADPIPTLWGQRGEATVP